jgi:hypothetical protein
MEKWNERTALVAVNNSGAEVRGKMITSKAGLRGLTGCSALDYLCNHCGYTSRL